MGSDPFDELDRVVEDFCRFMESLPPEALAESDWGPREVLAHLVFYHSLYVSQVEGILTGRALDLPSGRYSDLNAKVAADSRGVPLQALVETLRADNRRLKELYSACEPERMILPLKQGVRPYPLSVLIPEVAAHVRRHQQGLQKELRKKRVGA